MQLSEQRTLKWCKNHDTPLIAYGDGSWSCWWQLVVMTSDEIGCEAIDVSDRPGAVAETPGCNVANGLDMICDALARTAQDSKAAREAVRIARLIKKRLGADEGRGAREADRARKPSEWA